MLKKFRFLALAMTLVLILVSCTTFAAKKPVKLVFGHTYNPDHYFNKATLEFKRLVEKKTKGQILIDVFPSCQLGSFAEMNQATRTGGQDITLIGPGSFNTSYPKCVVFSLPYLFRSHQQIVKGWNMIVDERVWEDKTGVHVVGFWPTAQRELMTNRPVNKLEDLQGLKIRVPEDGISNVAWKAMGAITVTLSIADVYTALATGTADGLEQPLANLCSYKLYEVRKDVAFTDHLQEATVTIVNKNKWKSLTRSQQKIITDAISKTGDLVKDLLSKATKEQQEYLVQKGVKFTHPDVTPFKERVKKALWGQYLSEAEIKKIEALK
jgi:tripartite ATP-independent transporter DctP family solute receptor